MPPNDTRLVRLTRLPLDAAGPLRGALLDRGIDAMMLGEHRAGLAGVIPVTDAWVEICVPEPQLAEAQALLAEIVAVPPGDANGHRVCPRCDERSPSDWLECWSCGADLSQAAASDDRPPSTSAAGGLDFGSKPARRPWALLMVSLLAAFFAFQWLSLRAEVAAHPCATR